jgi:hypothetical protein
MNSPDFSAEIVSVLAAFVRHHFCLFFCIITKVVSGYRADFALPASPPE